MQRTLNTHTAIRGVYYTHVCGVLVCVSSLRRFTLPFAVFLHTMGEMICDNACMKYTHVRMYIMVMYVGKRGSVREVHIIHVLKYMKKMYSSTSVL